MPAKSEELPTTIARSPRKVREIYEKALDRAHKQYDSERRAHATAWAAVKNVAEKKGDRWQLKRRTGPSDEQAARGGSEARRRPRRTRGGVNAAKSKQELYEDARQADIGGRSRMTKDELVDALEKHSRRATAKARR